MTPRRPAGSLLIALVLAATTVPAQAEEPVEEAACLPTRLYCVSLVLEQAPLSCRRSGDDAICTYTVRLSATGTGHPYFSGDLIVDGGMETEICVGTDCDAFSHGILGLCQWTQAQQCTITMTAQDVAIVEDLPPSACFSADASVKVTASAGTRPVMVVAVAAQDDAQHSPVCP